MLTSGVGGAYAPPSRRVNETLLDRALC